MTHPFRLELIDSLTHPLLAATRDLPPEAFDAAIACLIFVFAFFASFAPMRFARIC